MPDMCNARVDVVKTLREWLVDRLKVTNHANDESCERQFIGMLYLEFSFIRRSSIHVHI